MTKFFRLSFLLVSLLAFWGQLSAQDDLFKRLFDKEEPEFQTTLVPTADSGTVMMIFYFTHSKVSSLETSIWVKDQGTNLMSEGENRMVRGAKEVRNRQEDTLLIRGLAHQHFYTIGVDYRGPKALSSKFNTKIARDGYRYEFASRPVVAKKTPLTSPPSEAAVDFNPDISIQVAPRGYCGDDDYPAVIVECENCKGQHWEFNVAYRQGNETWQSLRADGQNQSAFGNAVRTEPLCALLPGTYEIRVSAKGKNSPTPVVHYAGVPAVIKGKGKESLAEAKPNIPAQYQQPTPKSIATVPDTCEVKGQAVVLGQEIRGSLFLAAGSACAGDHPFARVRYVHPGYRDIETNAIPLNAGVPNTFILQLDARDLQRRIHTIQVITYIQQGDGAEIPMGAFWIKAEVPGTMNPTENYSAAVQTSNVDTPVKPVEYGTVSKGGTALQEEEDPFYEEATPTQNELNASGCTELQDFRLVYLSTEPAKPFYLSWMSPKCCRESGCQYVVYGGKDASQMRLLVEGSKPGNLVKELIQDVKSEDQYFEVAVRTAGGERRAAYVVGKGPIYGSAAIQEYTGDRRLPVICAPAVMAPETPANTEQPALGGALASRGVTEVKFQQPGMPISSFSPCKYKRETTVTAENPVIVGDELKISYNFTEKGYQYSLYMLPDGSKDWVLAPGTTELQDTPDFTFKAGTQHSGNYLILIYKADKNWGCLSSAPAESLVLKVQE